MKRVGPDCVEQVPVDGLVPEGLAPATGVGPGQLALGRHLALEALGVDFDAGLGRHLHGELDGEAVGVVQPEGRLPGHPARPVAQRLLEDHRTGVERAPERALLALDRLLDAVELVDEDGVGAARARRPPRRPAGRSGARDPELEGPSHGPADDATQDVAPSLVGRHDAVGHHHGHGPGVVGQDAQRHVGVGVGAVADLGDSSATARMGRKTSVSNSDVHALEHGEVALEPRPGVDALAGQVLEGAVGRSCCTA